MTQTNSVGQAKGKKSSEPVSENKPLIIKAKYKQVSLWLEIVDCAASAIKIEKAMLKLSGMVSARVNSVTSQLQLCFDPALISIADIETRLQKIGVPVSSQEAFNKNSETQKHRAQKLCLAVFFTAIHFLPALFDWLNIELEIPVSICFLLTSLTLFVLGARLFRGALWSITTLRLNMDLMAIIAACLAYFFSLYQWLQVDSNELYFHVCTIVITLALLIKWAKHQAMFHATEQLKNLLTLDVPIAHKWINDQLMSVAVNRLNPGDEIQVYAGELIPADGNVITGISRVDEQRLTGTKLPVPKQNNDYVLAGTTNLSAELRIRVSKKADNFQLNQIIRFLTKAQAPNPEAHQSIDKASVIFLLLITSAATISALYHGVTFGPSAAVISAISVLIVAFPYALNISAPYAFIVASSLGVKQGILFRNIQQLKQLARADKLVFSSSGTLTTGKHQVIKVEQWVESNRWQAAVKQIMLQSKHPLAESILPYLHKILPLQADFQYVNLGNTGIMATRDKFKLMIGTDEILKSHQVQIKKAHMRNLEPHHRRLWVVANKQIIARFDLKDQIRDNAHETIDTLRSLNLQLSLLKTGLSGANKAIAGALGISKLDSQLTKSTKKHTGKTALVGNGLTDSDELLSTADASIVLGSRENAAIGRGGINLMRQDIGLVYEAIQIAQKTDKLIRRNGLLSLGYNSVAIPLAMSGLINPVSAGLLATTISLSLLAHTHRLLSWQPTSVRSIFGSQKTKAQT